MDDPAVSLPFSPRALLCTAAVCLGIVAAATASSPGSLQPPRPQVPPTAPTAPAEQPLPNAYPGGALDINCSHVGDGLGGPGYQFIVSCPGRSPAPNRRWSIEQSAGEGGGVRLIDEKGDDLDDLPGLVDGMPFVLFWSPRSDWFFVNHYQGSTMEELRVFQIVNRQVVERSAVFAEAAGIAVQRYPCLRRNGAVQASGWRWSRDGRRIALVAYTHPAACIPSGANRGALPSENVESLWMIGDARSGRIDPASVRVRRDGVGDMPKDGPYAGL